MTTTPTPKGKWWQSFYEDTPFDIYLARTDKADLEATIAFLRDKLQVAPGASIFDQCCGLGGMSIPFAQLGFDVTGVDLCSKYIKKAKAEAERLGMTAQAHFFEGDACEFVPANSVDGAFNWFTSFGYFESDADNIKMLVRAFEALKPGRLFVLEFANIPFIIRNFKTSMKSQLVSDDGTIDIVRDCVLNLATGTMNQHWTFKMPDASELEHDSTLRAYMPTDLVRLFAQAGFTDIELFGGIAGEPLTIDSPRLIITGRKP